MDGVPALESELYFLVLHFLAGGPCQASVQQLEQEAVDKGLLPQRHDFKGNQHPMVYTDLKARYSHISPDALRQMIGRLLQQKQQELGTDGLSSVLGSGRLGIVPDCLCDTTPPAYTRPPAQHTLLPHCLMMREVGLKPPAPMHSYTMARHFCHQHTSRGHRQSVYCLTYDRSGAKIITGSDDYVVKIWSSQTGALLRTCRGHTAEIMDFSVSHDNTMVASASADCSIRVWSLQNTSLGYPLTVLLGHEKGVTWLDFNRVIKHALVSTSYDGTCCIWNAKDDRVAPIVMRPSAHFGQPAPGSTTGSAHSTGMNGTSHSAASTAAADGKGLKCCSFSPCGTFLVAGGSECISFIWAWDILPDTAAQPKKRSTAAAAPAGLQNSNPKAGPVVCAAPSGPRGLAPASRPNADGAAPVGCIVSQTPAVLDMGAPHMGAPHMGAAHLGGASTAALNMGAPHVGAAHMGASSMAAPNMGAPRMGAAHLGSSTTTAPNTGAPHMVATQMGSTNNSSATSFIAIPGSISGPVPTAANSSHAAPLVAAGESSRPGEHHTGGIPRPAAARVEPFGIAASIANGGLAATVTAGSGVWPRPRELAKLCGHKNDITLTQFSNSGNMLATASMDGSVRIWVQQKKRGRYVKAWLEKPKHILACPALPSSGRNRQRRRAFTNPSVNQVAWTADDVKVLATVSDNSLRVWCSETGESLHCLQGHTLQAHVLECHPTDCRIAMTAGYDGQVIMWDIELGLALRSFSTKDTCPCTYPWTDVIQLVDGHFSPDGCGFSASDTAGQLHIYGYGANPAMTNTPYDQFLSADYNPMQQDVRGYTMDINTQQPPHLMADTQPLCDYLMDPYCEDIQLAYRAGQLQSAPPVAIAQGQVLTHALLLFPPTTAAAAWLASEEGRADRAYVDRAMERHLHQLQAIAKGEAVPKKSDDPPNVFPTPQAQASSLAQVDLSTPHRRAPHSRPEAIDLTEGARSGAHPAVAPGLASPQMTSPNTFAHRGRHGPMVDLYECSDDSADEDAVMSEDGSDDVSIESLADEEEEAEDGVRLTRGSTSRRRREAVARKAQNLGKRRLPGQGRPVRESKRSRFDEENFLLDMETEDSASDYTSGEEDAQATSHRPKRRAAAHHSKPWMEGLSHSQGKRSSKKPSKRDEHWQAVRRLSDAGYQRGRDPNKYRWLLASQQSPACYIPQIGDEVVYLRDGHEEHMSNTKNKVSQLPSQALQHQYPGKAMRPAEPCEVVQLEYCVADDGNHNTVARLKLRMTDDRAPLYGCEFEVELPHPSLPTPDFVIHKALYDFGVAKVWTAGEKCKSYTMDQDDGVGGQWWLAVVVDDKLDWDSQAGVLNPYGSNQWQRYTLKWLDTDADSDEGGLSAWEIFAMDVESSYLREKMPALPEPTRVALLQAVRTLRAHERFEILAALPDSKSVVGGVPYNALVSLPMSLEEVEQRLENNFYRSLEAVRHDLQHIWSNTTTVVHPDAELIQTAKEMVDYMGLAMEGKRLPSLDGVPRRNRSHAKNATLPPLDPKPNPPSRPNGAGRSQGPTTAPSLNGNHKLAIKVMRAPGNISSTSLPSMPPAITAAQLPSTSSSFPTAHQPGASSSATASALSPSGNIKLKLRRAWQATSPPPGSPEQRINGQNARAGMLPSPPSNSWWQQPRDQSSPPQHPPRSEGDNRLALRIPIPGHQRPGPAIHSSEHEPKMEPNTREAAASGNHVLAIPISHTHGELPTHTQTDMEVNNLGGGSMAGTAATDAAGVGVPRDGVAAVAPRMQPQSRHVSHKNEPPVADEQAQDEEAQPKEEEGDDVYQQPTTTGHVGSTVGRGRSQKKWDSEEEEFPDEGKDLGVEELEHDRKETKKTGRRTAAKQARFGKRPRSQEPSSGGDGRGRGAADVDLGLDDWDDEDLEEEREGSEADDWAEEEDDDDNDSSDGKRRRKGAQKAKSSKRGGQSGRSGKSRKQKRESAGMKPFAGLKSGVVGIVTVNQWGRRNYSDDESEEERETAAVDEGVATVERAPPAAGTRPATRGARRASRKKPGSSGGGTEEEEDSDGGVGQAEADVGSGRLRRSRRPRKAVAYEELEAELLQVSSPPRRTAAPSAGHGGSEEDNDVVFEDEYSGEDSADRDSDDCSDDKQSGRKVKARMRTVQSLLTEPSPHAAPRAARSSRTNQQAAGGRQGGFEGVSHNVAASGDVQFSHSGRMIRQNSRYRQDEEEEVDVAPQRASSRIASGRVSVRQHYTVAATAAVVEPVEQVNHGWSGRTRGLTSSYAVFESSSEEEREKQKKRKSKRK